MNDRMFYMEMLYSVGNEYRDADQYGAAHVIDTCVDLFDGMTKGKGADSLRHYAAAIKSNQERMDTAEEIEAYKIALEYFTEIFG